MQRVPLPASTSLGRRNVETEFYLSGFAAFFTRIFTFMVSFYDPFEIFFMMGIN